MPFPIETQRFFLREMVPSDYPALCKIMQDDTVMYAYEGAFDDRETKAWRNEQFTRYEQLGFGLWAVILKKTGAMIGQCGLTLQNWKNEPVLEIGYLFQKEFWHQGYAIEAARACKAYAFQTLQAKEVFSIIRDANLASQNVARRNGMEIVDSTIKHYRGVDMPHFLFSVKRESGNSSQS